MKYSYTILRGKFSQEIFEQKIIETKKQLCKINNLSVNDFVLKRKSNYISYSANLDSFTGQYLEFEIMKNNNLIGLLGCFMDEKLNYINIE